jgi:hypothetical protein
MCFGSLISFARAHKEEFLCGPCEATFEQLPFRERLTALLPRGSTQIRCIQIAMVYYNLLREYVRTAEKGETLLVFLPFRGVRRRLILREWVRRHRLALVETEPEESKLRTIKH